MTLVRRFDGMDGSHWQVDAGPVDMLALFRASQGNWIAWKATQSIAMVDPTFARKRQEAKAVGFRSRFFYHWLSSTRDVAAQVAHYLRTLGPLEVGEGVMLDAEEAGITVESCLAWLEGVEAVTRRPSDVYTGLYVAGGTIWRDPRIRMSKYGPRPMHLAAYISVSALTARLAAQGVAHLPVHAWQYSSDGPVPGVVGRCDMNSILDRAAFDRACGLDTPVPTPIPIPIPVPLEDDPMFNNSEPHTFDGVLYPIGHVFYYIMSDGSKRHITRLSEVAARGGVTKAQPLSNTDIADLPSWVAPTTVASGPLVVNLSGSFSGSATPR